MFLNFHKTHEKHAEYQCSTTSLQLVTEDRTVGVEG